MWGFGERWVFFFWLDLATWGLGCRVLGFRVLGFRVEGLGLRV